MIRKFNLNNLAIRRGHLDDLDGSLIEKNLVAHFEHYEVFTIEPLLASLGHTIGNAVRRILLSFSSGLGITGVKISGVLHEFETIEGCKYDVSTIISNLKKIKFAYAPEDIDHNSPIVVEVKNIQGVLCAREIEQASEGKIKILNPELEILEMLYSTINSLTIRIEYSFGFTPSWTQSTSTDSYIKMGTQFSPLLRCAYCVSNASNKYGENMEKLTFFIATNGAVSPFESLMYACNKLTFIFNSISSKTLLSEEESIRLKTDLNALENSKVELEEISEDSYNIFDNVGSFTKESETLESSFVAELEGIGISRGMAQKFVKTGLGLKELLSLDDDIFISSLTSIDGIGKITANKIKKIIDDLKNKQDTNETW